MTLSIRSSLASNIEYTTLSSRDLSGLIRCLSKSWPRPMHSTTSTITLNAIYLPLMNRLMRYYIILTLMWPLWQRLLVGSHVRWHSLLVPIVINTGAIQAFERYFDWTQFTVKMNISTFENPGLFIKYRQKLRIEVDLVRSILEEYWHELAVEYAYSSKNYSQNSPHRTKNNFKLELQNPSSISMKKLLETTIYKKLIAIRKVFRRFIYHETGEVGRPNAYRLLTLEMWCRVAPPASKPSVCSRPVNAISALKYV